MKSDTPYTAATAPTLYVDVAGSTIAYRTFGTGSPMILLNRMRGTLDTWDPLFLDELAETHNVITIDYPGVGYSDGALPPDMGKAAAFVDAFAAAIDVRRFVVVGWSWGGQVAQAFLLDYPQRVSHAVLIGTNPAGPVEIPLQQVFLERAFKPVNDLADEVVLFFEPRSQASRRAAKASHDRIYARPDVVAKIPSTMSKIEAFIAAGQEFREDHAGRRARLMATRMPILVICGDHDTSTAGQNWFPLLGHLPNAHVVIFPESGHGPQHQYPELTAHHIDAFLKYAVR
jgi:pimeloyl-ACP methyl ester carboxylesterase